MNWVLILSLWCFGQAIACAAQSPTYDVLIKEGTLCVGLRTVAKQGPVPMTFGTNAARLSTRSQLVIHFANPSTNRQGILFFMPRSVFLELVDEQGDKARKTKHGREATGEQIPPPRMVYASPSVRKVSLWPGEAWHFVFGRWNSLFEINPGKQYELCFRFMYWSSKERAFVLSDELKLPVVFEEPPRPE